MPKNKIPSNCHPHLLFKDYNIIKFIFAIWTLYLISETFYTFLVLKPTFTSHERRNMSVDDYPDIILCPENPNDLDGLRSLGYGGPSGYFKGSGKYGWGNNSDHIKNLSIAVSTLKSVKDCQTRKSSFMFYPNRRMDEKVKFNLTAALNPHLTCCKVMPSKHAKSYPLLQFKFGLYPDIINNSFKVFMADQMTASIFDQHKEVMLGDRLVSSNDGYMVYKVKILEDSNIEGDPKYPCKDYKIIGEYAKCLENEIINIIIINM